MLAARRRCEADRPHRHHRGSVGHQLASGAAGLGRGRRAAMRLLPVGTDHGGGSAAQEEYAAERRRHRRGDDQHLSLRDLPAHSRRRAHGGQYDAKRCARAWLGCAHQHHALKGRPAMNKQKLSRRTFMVGTAATGSLALGFHLPALSSAAAQTAAANDAEVNAWVVIRPDDACVIRIARSEMGQGTLTGLAQLVAEELECDWKKVSTESITAGQNLARKRVWGEMSTGGSRGIRTSQDY